MSIKRVIPVHKHMAPVNAGANVCKPQRNNLTMTPIYILFFFLKGSLDILVALADAGFVCTGFEHHVQHNQAN